VPEPNQDEYIWERRMRNCGLPYNPEQTSEEREFKWRRSILKMLLEFRSLEKIIRLLNTRQTGIDYHAIITV
jgi:hypothetical protein